MAGTACEWRNKAEEEARAVAVPLTLPSGMTVMARRPSPVEMAMWSRLPLHLAAEAAGPGEKASPEQVLENIEATRQLLIYACVSPRISLEPKDDNEIHPRHIPLKDSIFLIRWAMRMQEADDLRPFRPQPADADAGGDGEDVRAAAERVAGGDGAGASASARPSGSGDSGGAGCAGDGRVDRGRE